MSQIIEHTGVIKHISPEKIQVLVTQQSACSGCHVKSSCTAADKSDKIIDAEPAETDFKVGDHVVVYARRSLGLKAVLLVFVIPFLLILLILSLVYLFMGSDNDVLAGLISLSGLIPYYIILFLFDKKITSTFRFYVRKADDTDV